MNLDMYDPRSWRPAGTAIQDMHQPTTTLTRAAKERAVSAMALRLTVTGGRYDRSRGTPMIEDHARAMRRQHKALVRLAMARTVEDGTR